MKRIFYFNITYGCNSNCKYCYSHSTHHNAVSYNEIQELKFFEYLEKNQITPNDRVIINGGEPFLHSEIRSLLLGLAKYNCEVLIYTNGRLIRFFDLSGLSKKYRFVVPIHGYEEIHDQITGVSGSYKEALNGLRSLVEMTDCLVDIKIIINNEIISKDKQGEKFLKSLNDVEFNNAVHITKMADTIVSRRNNCISVDIEDAAIYTRLLYDYFKEKKVVMKFFDNCIKALPLEKNEPSDLKVDPFVVFFKDRNHFREIRLIRSKLKCMEKCICSDRCFSAVNEYKVLEYKNGTSYVSLE